MSTVVNRIGPRTTKFNSPLSVLAGGINPMIVVTTMNSGNKLCMQIGTPKRVPTSTDPSMSDL